MQRDGMRSNGIHCGVGDDLIAAKDKEMMNYL